MKIPSQTPCRLPGVNAPENAIPSGLDVSAKWIPLIHSAFHSLLLRRSARLGGVAEVGFMKCVMSHEPDFPFASVR